MDHTALLENYIIPASIS